MSTNSKSSKILLNQKLNASQQSLPNQWQIHNNRLNYLQQTVTRIQKKIQKLQTNIYTVSQNSNSFKEEFRQKLNEMITIVSLPTNDMQNNSQQLEQLNSQINEIKLNLLKHQTRFNKVHQEINHLLEKNTFKFTQNEIQQFVNDKIIISEQKNKKYIGEKLVEVNKIIQELQLKISQNSKKEQTEYLNNNRNYTQQQQSNFLNTSAFSKASSQNCLSNSRSQSKLANSRSSNIYENAGPDRDKIASRRLNFTTTEDDKRIQSKQVTSLELPGQTGRNNSSTSTHLSGIPPTSQNNSRVVYLRQKLKEFEQINKKYQKKQVEYESRKNEISSNQHQHQQQTQKSRSIKNSSSLYKYQGDNIECEQDLGYGMNLSKKLQYNNQRYQPNSSSSSKQQRKQQQKATQSQTSRRQDSTSKRYSTINNNNSHNKHSTTQLKQTSSAKKIDKLKSIKDYLQQTQSEIEDSFIEPNYINQHNR